MKKLRDNGRKISTKNYYFVVLIAVLVVALMLYIRSFIITYKSNTINTSIFKDNIQSISIDDLYYSVSEMDDVIIYVSYTGNEDVMNMESKLYKYIKKNKLNDKIVYLDITDKLNGGEYITTLRNRFSNVSNEINSAPLLIYIKNGEAVSAMSSELKMIDYTVLEKINNENSNE